MTKTKATKTTKHLRRKNELIKAQAKTGIRGNASDIASPEGVAQPKKLSQRLYLPQIKTDLIKTVIFAVVVIGFLFFLKSQNLEFDFGIYK